MEALEGRRPAVVGKFGLNVELKGSKGLAVIGKGAIAATLPGCEGEFSVPLG